MDKQQSILPLFIRRQNDRKDIQKQLKWRSLRRRSSIALLIVLLIVGGSVLIAHTLERDTSRTFPTQTFTVGAHPTLILHTVNTDIHILYGGYGHISVETKGGASGLDIGSNLDLSSFKMVATQRGDTMIVNTDANVTVVGANKDFALTITVSQATLIEGDHQSQ